MQEKYLAQLKKGCKKKCHRVFCYMCPDQKCALGLANVLAEYGNIFSCSNITGAVTDRCTPRNYIDRGCIILDFYFYIATFLQECSCIDKSVVKLESECDKKSTVHFTDNGEKFNLCAEGIDASLNTASLLDYYLSVEKRAEIHIYCKFINKDFFLEEEVYLLEGLLYLILERFKASNEFFLRSFAIRLFNIVNRYKMIKQPYLSIMTSVFFNMQSMHDEITSICSEYIGADSGKQGFQCPKCFVSPKLTFEDYNDSVDTIVCILKNIKNTDIRTNAFVEDTLNILKILYLTNEKTRLYSYERFYLYSFSRRIDINEEFKYYKRGEKSVFSYTFILPLSKKSDFIKYENSDLVKESLQETFFRALFEGEKVPYFFVKINRKTVYKETLWLLKKTPNSDLRKQVKVTFRNEEGQDQGGIKKEYFQLLSEEIREERRLFEIKNKSIWFRLSVTNPKAEFESIGKIIGIALYNDVVLNLPFPTLFFKRLLDKNTELADLEEIEPSTYNALGNLLRFTEEELDCCKQTFEIVYESGNKVLKKQLIKDGQNIRVTKENVNVFVEKYVKFLTSDSVEPYMKSIRKGFLAIIQPTSFEFLHAKELEKIIVGSKYIDIRKIKEMCIYRGYSASSNIIKWFWEIIKDYNTEMKEKLLQFCTGNDRMPVTEGSIKLIIMRNGCDTERLPSAQTCFNTLMIPEYNTKEKLLQKLGVAISYTKGFYLV